MQLLTCALLLSTLLLDFLRLQFRIPLPFMFIPELLSGIALIIFLNRLSTGRNLLLPPFYVLVFTLLLLHIIATFVISDATIGPIIGGLREYLKYLPFFLIPLTYQFTERQLSIQFKLLIALSLIQLPIGIIQRISTPFWHRAGDVVKGTFSTGSMAAVFLLMGVAILIGLYLKGHLTKWRALFLGIFMFLPTTIGDTKAVLVLLPIAVAMPLFFRPSEKGVWSRGGVTLLIILGATSSFLLIADSVSKSYGTREGSMLEIFLDPDKFIHYLAPQLAGKDVAADRHGRLDKVVAPIVEHHDKPLKLIAGLGLGAVNVSPIESFAADQHADLVRDGRVGVSMSKLLWELGLLGTFLILLLFGRLWWDAFRLRNIDHYFSGIALGWLAAVPILIVAMCWKAVIANNAVMFSFAYLSGHIVARSRMLALQPQFSFVPPNEETEQHKPQEPRTNIPGILNQGRSRA